MCTYVHTYIHTLIYNTLHYTTLHYTTLHYISLHTIPYHTTPHHTTPYHTYIHIFWFAYSDPMFSGFFDPIGIVNRYSRCYKTSCLASLVYCPSYHSSSAVVTGSRGHSGFSDHLVFFSSMSWQKLGDFTTGYGTCGYWLESLDAGHAVLDLATEERFRNLLVLVIPTGVSQPLLLYGYGGVVLSVSMRLLQSQWPFQGH